MLVQMTTNRAVSSSKRFRPQKYFLCWAKLSRSVLAAGVFAWTSTVCAQITPVIEQQFQQASEAMRQGRLPQAEEGFAAVVRGAPNFAEAHLNLGLVREEQGRHDDAVASLQKALQLKPGLRGANLFLGIALYRSNHLDLALTALRKEAVTYPKDANAWMWVGVVALEKGYGEEAADALDKAAKLAPDNVDILYHRGQAHLFVSKESYAQMFKADPKSWRVRQILAEANADAERHLDAIAEYRAAINLAPNEPRLHEELGTELRVAGKMQEAEEAFRKELELDPYNAVAKYKLGVIAIERGNAPSAKQLIGEALKVRPDLRHGDYNLGRAEALAGEDEAAMKHFEKATAIETEGEVLLQAWFQLGMVYRRLHRMTEAQQAIATFQKLKNEEAEKSQEQLKKLKVQQDPEVAQPADTDSKPE
jgi:tetratricopeptide (TPR) repeat protein